MSSQEPIPNPYDLYLTPEDTDPKLMFEKIIRLHNYLISVTIPAVSVLAQEYTVEKFGQQLEDLL